MGERRIIDQHWSFPDGEVVLIITSERPLTAAEFAAIGPAADAIERLAEVLTKPQLGEDGEHA